MHAVGSILAIGEHKFMVCGYRPLEADDGTVGVGYLLLPYPLGFVNVDSFSLVPAQTDYPTVHEGWRNDDAEQLDRLLDQARTYGAQVPMDDYLAAQEQLAADFEAEFLVAETDGSDDD